MFFKKWLDFFILDNVVIADAAKIPVSGFVIYPVLDFPV